MSRLTENPATIPPDRPTRAARWAVSCLFLGNGIVFGTWVSRIPAMEAQHGISHGTFGLLLLCMAFGALLSMPLAGWLGARFGSSRVCQVTALSYCVLLPLLPLMGSPLALAPLLFIFGIAHGALDVAMNAQAVSVETHYPRPIMSMFHALFSLGGLIGSGAGGLIAGYHILPAPHFLGVGLVIGLITAFFALSRLLPGRDPGAAKPEPVTPSARRSIFSPLLLALGAIAFCAMMSEGAMGDWTALYLQENTGSSEAVAAIGYSAFSIAMAVGRFFGDAITVRLGPARIVRYGGVLALASLALALLFPVTPVALLSFVFVGIGLAIMVPQVFTAAAAVPGANPSEAVAAVSTFGYFGFLIGPPCIGFLAQALGLRTALWLVVLMCAILAKLASRVRPAAPPTGALRTQTNLVEEIA